MRRICPVLGNNDVWPDYRVNFTTPDFYARQADAFEELCDELSAADKATLRHGGYYKQRLRPSLHMLALNTDVYSASAPGTSGNEQYTPLTREDPFGQFAWLAAALAELAASGERVYIAGHAVPALDSYGHHAQWQEGYAARFYDTIRPHAGVIDGLFFGHLHSAEFRTTSAVGLPGGMPPILVYSAITPIYYNSPSYYVLTLGRRAATARPRSSSGARSCPR